jgi:hypothetical protein
MPQIDLSDFRELLPKPEQARMREATSERHVGLIT